MQPSRNKARQALNQLLNAIVPQKASQATALKDAPNKRINRCLEQVKATVSKAAVLIADCAPRESQ